MMWDWVDRLLDWLFPRSVTRDDADTEYQKVKTQIPIEQRATVKAEENISRANPKIVKLCAGKRHAWCDIGIGRLVRLRVKKREVPLV